MTDSPPFEHWTSEGLTNVFHLLRAPRRRLLVQLLGQEVLPEKVGYAACLRSDDGDPQISVRAVARNITAIEQDVPLDHATGSSYHSVYTSLTQTHLPLLDAADLITYDADRKTLAVNHNILPVAIIAAISAPVSHMLLDETEMTRLVKNGHFCVQDSIGD